VQYQNDTILRLIEQMGGLIRRALEQMRESGNDEPYRLADEAVGLAMGMDPGLVAHLSPQALTSVLELSSADDRVLQLLAQAFEMQASICQSRGDLTEGALRASQAAAVRALLDPARGN
jgi:alanine dehydrogenase